MYFVKQSVQDDSSSLLDVNAESAVPEDLEDPDWKVSDSLTLNLHGGLQCDLIVSKKHSSPECSSSIDYKATGMWQNINHIL